MKLLTQILAVFLIASQATFANPPEKGLASYYDDSFHGRKTASGEKYDKNKLTAAHKTLPFGTKVKIVNPANNKSVEVIINDRGPYIKGRIIELSKKAAQQIDLVKAGVAQVEITILSGATNTKPTPAVTAKTDDKKNTTTAATTTTKSNTKATASKTSSTKKTSKTKATPKPADNTNMIVEAKDMETGGLYKMQVLKLQAKGFGVQVAGYSDYQSVVSQLAVFQENWFKGATVYVDKLNGKPYYKIILGPMTTKEEAASYCESIKSKYKIKDAFVVNIEELAAKK